MAHNIKAKDTLAQAQKRAEVLEAMGDTLQRSLHAQLLSACCQAPARQHTPAYGCTM